MRGILLLAILSIKSSYSQKEEMPLERTDDIPDTLQWWFGESGCWRIRTYALDHDVHAFKIGNSVHTTLDLAKKNNQDNYGDVIAAQHVIHFVDCSARGESEAEFGRIGLVSRLQFDLSRFVFWKPDDAEYLTKSLPNEQNPSESRN
jgi:hypothetical protein